MSDLRVSEIRFAVASRADMATGLLGWVSCTLNGLLRIDGLSLRRTLAGTFTISFPTRTDRAGARHAYIRPLSNDARRDLEGQILTALAAALSAAAMTGPTGQGESGR
jgi:hypothetical protein